MRFSAQVFGPDLPSAGQTVECETDTFGIRVETPEAVTIRWSELKVEQGGWDRQQIRLEWSNSSGTFALNIKDAGVTADIARFAGKPPSIPHQKTDRRTRLWVQLAIWLFVVLPLLLVGVLIWQREAIVWWAVSRIPINQEVALGETVFAQHKLRLKLVDGPSAEMVREIGTQLTKGSPYPFQFFVAEDPSVNAFAIPGGVVVVHTGLIQLAATPEEVAGVLAHEVSHVERRHSLRGMVQSAGMTATIGLVFGDLGSLATVGGGLLDLKFSRDHETEADREGLKALIAARIAPAGMRDFFAKMGEKSAGEKASMEVGFFSTHPTSVERMTEIELQIQSLPQEAREGESLKIDFAAIKASLEGKSSTPAQKPEATF